jgi:hypothetical protein
VAAEDPAEDHHHLSIDDAVEFAGQIARMKVSKITHVLTQLMSFEVSSHIKMV